MTNDSDIAFLSVCLSVSPPVPHACLSVTSRLNECMYRQLYTSSENHFIHHKW